jgi:excisionase family DNA binding protein
MTVRQAAEILGVGRYRVHAMIKQGQLTAEKRASDAGIEILVLKRAEVDALAEERRKIVAGDLPPRGGRKPNAPAEPGGRNE